MPREERTTTAVSSTTPLTNKQKIPPEVHRQLTADFLPAVKEVAAAGAELLKNYKAVEMSSENYARALDSLAKSSKSADKKAQEYGRELHDAIKEYNKMIGYHKGCVEELALIVKKTTQYSSEEKAQLKETFSKYQKEEKDLLKHQKKGTKSSTDVDEFYDKSAREFMRQQEMRYKFFLDRHKRWFNKYGELMQKISAEKAPLSNGHAVQEAPKPAEEPKPAVEATKESETPVLGNGVHPESKPNGEVVAEVATAAEVHKVESSDDPPFLHSGNSSPRSSISSMTGKLPSRRPTNEIIPGVTLLKEERRPAANSEHYSASINITQDKFDQPAPTHRSDAVQTEAAPTVVLNVPAPVPLPREERRALSPERTPAPVIHEQPAPKKFEYRGPIIVPAPIPRTREPEIIRPTTPMMVPRTVDAQVYANAMRPHSESRISYAPPPQERPHYHVEAEYNPTVSPAHRPPTNYTKQSSETVVVPSMFNASDYGRTLTVTQDFNASSGEQITINRGDRVILIKSGSRGWIFIQDQATQRTGWIPAPYVSY